MTLLPRADDGAQAQGGASRAGMDADLLIFDPKRFATARISPSRPPETPRRTFVFVIVSGEIAAENGRATGVMAGKTLDSFDFIIQAAAPMAGLIPYLTTCHIRITIIRKSHIAF